MTKELAWLRVIQAAHKVTGCDVMELPSGRSPKHVSFVRGMVYHILDKYYDLTRQQTAELAGTDHGTVSYHILLHDKRYKKEHYYFSMYDKIVSQLFGTGQRERYNMIDELINKI